MMTGKVRGVVEWSTREVPEGPEELFTSDPAYEGMEVAVYKE